MSSIKNLKNVDEIHEALFNADKAKVKIYPEIGFKGRRFRSETLESFILNDLVKQLLFVTKYSQQPNNQNNKKITEIVSKIKKIDIVGNLALKEKNIFMNLIIRICRFFKNLGFDRNKVLQNLARDFKPQENIIPEAKLVRQAASQIKEPELPHVLAEKIQEQPIPALKIESKIAPVQTNVVKENAEIILDKKKLTIPLENPPKNPLEVEIATQPAEKVEKEILPKVENQIEEIVSIKIDPKPLNERVKSAFSGVDKPDKPVEGVEQEPVKIVTPELPPKKEPKIDNQQKAQKLGEKLLKLAAQQVEKFVEEVIPPKVENQIEKNVPPKPLYQKTLNERLNERIQSVAFSALGILPKKIGENPLKIAAQQAEKIVELDMDENQIEISKQVKYLTERVPMEPVYRPREEVKQEPVKIVPKRPLNDEPKMEKPVLPVVNIIPPLHVNEQIQRVPVLEIDQDIKQAQEAANGNEKLKSRNLSMVIKKALDNKYFDKAEQIIPLITDLETKDFALCDISQAMASHKMFQESLGVAERINDKPVKDVALRDLSKAYADDELFNSAQIIVDKLSNNYEKNTQRQYISIAMFQKGRKMKDILDVVNMIDDLRLKDSAFNAMVKMLIANNDLDIASELADLMYDKGLKMTALTEINRIKLYDS